MGSRAQAFLIRAFALALLLAGPVAAEEEEWTRPWPGLLPPSAASTIRTRGFETGTLRSVSPGQSDFVATRILDRETGKPLPGARLRRYDEDVGGLPLRFAKLLGEGVADADGFAWVPVDGDDHSGHWVAQAPGYAPIVEFVTPSERMALRRGVEVRSRLLDSLGRPIEGAEVEWWLGCPHAPALGVARTDAEGEFLLLDVDAEGEVWYVLPAGRGALERNSMPLHLGTRRYDLVARAGVTVRGRILDPEGKPITGAVVRGAGYPRGPAAATGEDGAFVLTGVDEGTTCEVYLPGRPKPAVASFDAPPEGVEPTLRVSPRGHHRILAPRGTLRIKVREMGGGPVGELVVRFYDEEGEEWREETDARTETVEFEVPGGTYRVAEGSPFDRLGLQSQVVEVVPGERREAEVPAFARLPLRVVGLREGDAYRVATRTEEMSVDPGDEPPRLPPEEPAVVWYDGEAFAVGPPESMERTVTVRRAPRHVVRRADGLPMADSDSAYLVGADCWVDAEVRDGRLETRAAGPIRLMLDLEEVVVDLPSDRFVEIAVDVPPVDEDEEGTASQAILHVRRHDGTVPEDLALRESEVPGSSSVSSGGASDPIEANVPSHLEITSPGLATFELDVREAGERTLTWGPCGLRLSVLGPDGAPADALVSVDGPVYETKDGRLVLDGLDAGPHRVLVSPLTRKHAGVEMRVVLKEGDLRERTVRLTTR